ncbi:MAG TPA: PIN domain-containing protein [archaeon]|nr:PIN domain-containing protein [archaeon]
MYCLDTDIIAFILRGDEKIKKKISSVDPESISITTITLCELFKGAYKSSRAKENVSMVHDILRNYNLLSLNITSSEIYGMDFIKLEKEGKLTQVLDLMIASIAKANNLILITRNKKDFENIPDLKLEVW